MTHHVITNILSPGWNFVNNVSMTLSICDLFSEFTRHMQTFKQTYFLIARKGWVSKIDFYKEIRNCLNLHLPIQLSMAFGHQISCQSVSSFPRQPSKNLALVKLSSMKKKFKIPRIQLLSELLWASLMTLVP